VSHFRCLSIVFFYHIWCLSHRTGLAVGCAIKSFEDDKVGVLESGEPLYYKFDFIAILKRVIAAIRHNKAAFRAIGSHWNTLCDVRWDSLKRVTTWLNENEAD
jgi:hypothetical protein